VSAAVLRRHQKRHLLRNTQRPLHTVRNVEFLIDYRSRFRHLYSHAPQPHRIPLHHVPWMSVDDIIAH